MLKGDLKKAIETHQMLYEVSKKHTFLPEVHVGYIFSLDKMGGIIVCLTMWSLCDVNHDVWTAYCLSSSDEVDWLLYTSPVSDGTSKHHDLQHMWPHCETNSNALLLRSECSERAATYSGFKKNI